MAIIGFGFTLVLYDYEFYCLNFTAFLQINTMGCMEVGMAEQSKVMQVKESVDLFKEHSLKELDATSALDKIFIKNADLKEILDNYTLLTNPELTGTFLKNFQASLKQDIVEYLEDKIYVNALEDLSKIAFFRLQKISKKHYLETAYGSDPEKINALKIQAVRIKKEYEILSVIT